MLISLDDNEALSPGTQITFAGDRSFVRLEEYKGFEDSWVELGTGRLWHFSKLIPLNESAEATVRPKRR